MALDEFSTGWKIWPNTLFTLDRLIFWLCLHDLWTTRRLNFHTVKVRFYMNREPNRTNFHFRSVMSERRRKAPGTHKILPVNHSANTERRMATNLLCPLTQVLRLTSIFRYNLSNLLISVMFSSDVRASTWNRERRNGKWRSIWFILIPMKRLNETQVRF